MVINGDRTSGWFIVIRKYQYSRESGLTRFLVHRTVSYISNCIVPQQTVYRSKKYRTMLKIFVLKTQVGVKRSVSKMFIITEKLEEREPCRIVIPRQVSQG
jgi:hypothetical protein